MSIVLLKALVGTRSSLTESIYITRPLLGMQKKKKKTVKIVFFNCSRLSPCSFHNRQLAKLSSGNEVWGKIAVPVVQMTVNFIYSFAIEMASKNFSSSFRSGSGEVSTLTSSSQSFCAIRAHFWGKKANLFDRKRR